MTTTYTIGAGYDTCSSTAASSANFSANPTIITGSFGLGNSFLGYLYVPLPAGLIGSTVLSAILVGHAVPAYSAQTVTVKPVTSTWAASTLTNSNSPTVGTGVNTSIGAGGVGSQVSLTVTSIIQAVASGADWFGFQLSSSSTFGYASFESGNPSWTLTIVTTDAPEVPQSLVPNGTVVASGAPVVTCDFSDNGGLSNDMAQMQVQVSTSTSFVSPAYDHTIATTVPVFDLAANAFTPVSSGTTRWWRVQTFDVDGNASGFSATASFTYRSQPSLTLLTPAAGVVYDPTTVVAATSGANMSAYRVQITDGSDRTSIRFDSGRTAANPAALTSVAVAIPQEYPIGFGGSRVLVDGSTYQLHIQTWDTFLTRQSTPGSPAYVESWTTFVFADDAGVTAPTTLTVDQLDLGPGVTLTWTRAAAPDGWVILRQGTNDTTPKVINRSDGTDVLAGPSTYSWVDNHPQPWVQQTYTVKAITNVSSVPHQSQPSPAASIVPQGLGVWIYTQSGQRVVLDGNAVDQLTVSDRRTSYKPLNVGFDVDIVTGYEGLSGTFTGSFPSDVDPTQDITDVQDILLSIRANPSQWVRLVYGTFSGRVLLRNVSILPSPLGNSAAPIMNVSFGVNQVGDFDQVRA